MRRNSTGELRTGLRRSCWLEYVYTYCTQIFAACLGREKICQVHFRTGRCETFYGERRSCARRDDQFVTEIFAPVIPSQVEGSRRESLDINAGPSTLPASAGSAQDVGVSNCRSFIRHGSSFIIR